MKTIEERFLEKFVQADTGCWLWIGCTNSGGYGEFKVAGKMVKAHRFSYEYFAGKPPKDLCVLHSCDTPLCVNPEHLCLGTHQQNMDDKVAKGRQAKLAGNKNPNFGKHLSDEHKSKLSDWNTGRTMSDDTKAKLSAALSGDKNPMFGKHHTNETKAKLSYWNTGKTVSDETKAKLSAAKTGDKHPNFGKTGDKSPNFGKKYKKRIVNSE